LNMYPRPSPCRASSLPHYVPPLQSALSLEMDFSNCRDPAETAET
jgi:hypothetical protein